MSRTVLETPRFSVIRHTEGTGAGSRQHYLVVKPNAVLVVASSGTHVPLLFARKPLVDYESFELPGGRIEAGESPEEAAKRELFEETGLSCTSLQKLSSFHPLPSVTNEMIFVFQAQVDSHNFDLHACDPEGEGIIGLEWVSYSHLRDMLSRFEFACSADAYAIMMFCQKNGIGHGN